MKNKISRFVLSALVLVLGAALEDMLPHFLSVGFPILMTAVVILSLRASFPAVVLFALCAAAFEDSLSMLPILTSAGFFLGMAALARFTRLGVAVLLVSCPIYQLWLTFWVPSIDVPVILRMFAALPMGIVTAFVVARVLMFVESRVVAE